MEGNLLNALSEAMVNAVECAAASTVRVDARGRGSASGVIYQPDRVLTASHSVEREDNIQVQLPDGSLTAARLAGRDPASDLALLILDRQMAVPAQPAPAEAQVGQFVIALARPDEDGVQASMGVVGAVSGPLTTGRGHVLERFIRTDAIPYPGFSGGPLVEGEGRVLGINTSGFTQGASIAVPVAHAWRVADSLSRYGRVRRGYLGVRSQPVELPAEAAHALGRSQPTGLLLVGVERGQPGDRAGLMVGDILVGIDGNAVEDHEALVERLSGDAAGTTLQVEILRGGRPVRVPVVAAERR